MRLGILKYTYYYLDLFFFLLLFIFGCVGSSLLRAGFLQLQRAGATLRCSAQASLCGGFSCCSTRALEHVGSVVVARGLQDARSSVVVMHRLSSCGSQSLECRLSSCGTRALLLCGMWDLPGPGIEPVSPALVGRFLTTVPPGKSLDLFFCELPVQVFCLVIIRLSFTFFFLIFTYLFIQAAPGLSCGTQELCCGMQTSQLQHVVSQLQHAGSSSLTRDQTRVPYIGSAESYPLDHQGSPMHCQ